MKPYRPFDIVTDNEGNVGMIIETSNNHNDGPKYSIEWLVGKGDYNAWWKHSDLTLHSNVMIIIAKEMAHPMGNNGENVEELFN